MKRTLYPIALCLVAGLLLSACSLLQTPTASVPTAAIVEETVPTTEEEIIPTALPTVSETEVAKSESGDHYPATPEEVVKAFVSLYPDNPEQMRQYLSSNLISKLPKGGPIALLKFNGALSGFSIDSAAVNPDPAGAIIKVRVDVGGAVKNRTFVLVKEKEHWVIDAVRIPKS